MKTKPVLLCVAVALFSVTQGCSVGKEFVTAFLTNYKGGHIGQKLQLAITSQGIPATVQIRLISPPFTTTVRLGGKETKWVKLPGQSELQKSGLSFSVVQVSSSADVSLVAFNTRDHTGDSSKVLPSHQLGVEYWAYTPAHGASLMKLLAVVNGPQLNTVTFQSPTSVKINGIGTWKAGQNINVILKPYQSYLLQSKSSLTGMQVKSQHPLAVLAGHQCSWFKGPCNHVYEQLLPLHLLSTSYLVPAMHPAGHSEDQAHIIATEDGTVVTVIRGKSATSQKLQAGKTFFERVTFGSPLLIQSNKKVMVMYYSNNKPFDPFLTSILPSSQSPSDWSVDTLDGFKSTAVVLSLREGVHSVNIYGKKTIKNVHIQWNTFLPDDKYVWSIVSLGKKQDNYIIKGDSILSVYVYGGKARDGYGTSGVCSSAAVPPTPPPDPCDKIKCREKEECQKGECVHISKATCHAVGDPHYQTFDGYRFDFQGTCTYTMATVTDLTQGLAAFTVLTKNNHRGKRTVSYVRTVTITVYNQTVVVSSQRSMVQVNGELIYLPISLAGGKLKIVQRGHYAVLTTDFGLEVKYNWNMHLYITVPSSYFRLLGGLCGNYNGDRGDDRTSPLKTVLPMVLEFAKSWKGDDKDSFCNDDCKGSCPECSPQLQKRYGENEFCGILTKTDGPFASCHKALDPSIFFDNCIFDVCINKGARMFFCDNLKLYDDACLAKGVKISPQWRMDAKCPLQCPANSHYDACGSACPASCIDLDAPAQCKEPCVEGCQCNSGFVLSGESCVRSTSCGCQYQGHYYPTGTTFWVDSQCNKRCRCVPGKAEAQCESTTCKKSEVCELRNGVKDCYPTSFSTCQASGDPHYRTFDGRRFDFQGTCTYVLSRLVGTGGTGSLLTPFEVQVQNENRGRNKAVAYTKTVSITVLNHTLTLSSDNPGKVVILGQYVNLPFEAESGQLSVLRIGYFGVVRTSFGLTLKFDWRSHVALTLPSSYSAVIAGLCGNWNGQPGDDFLKPDRSPAPNPTAFGSSWQVGGAVGCSNDCPGGQCPKCHPTQRQKYQSGVYCGRITDKSGPFRQCHAKVDPQDYLEDCVFDLCVYGGHASVLCSAFTSYTTACQDAQATVETWRSDSLCPSSCPANSQYEVCAPGCPETCSQLKEDDSCNNAPCREGCICNDGFLLSDNMCVPVAECGCVYQGQYYTSGQVFIPGTGGHCSPRCVCSDDGEVVCDTTFTCGANEECALRDGLLACVPKKISTCHVGGVREYKSFDGRAFSVYGDCVYKLVEVEQDGGMTPFTVIVQQQTAEGGVTRRVEIQTSIYKITMIPGLLWQVVVNEIRAHLPLSLGEGKVLVNQNGVNIVVVTDFGLKVTYDTVGGVIVHLPSTYNGITLGLCGNYNNELNDDFRLPDNTQALSEGAFTAGWVISEKGVTCQTGCNGSVCPEPEPQKKPESEKACDIIRARQGPFAACHAVVPPSGYYEACVKELTLPGGGQEVLCRHIQIYASLCQGAGATVISWRNNSFCPLQCPAKTHYELCSDTCSSTCASLSAPARCPPCQEGCQCDEGLVFDGGVCVAMDTCGCVVKGRYYKSGQSVMMEECQEVCSCKAGQFTCQNNQCDKGDECRVKGGVLGCYLKDPCVDMQCREKERCVVEKDQAVCEALSKAVCWVMGDPHFSTFDGTLFSFQGTRSYTLVNTTRRDPTLTDFNILTKNELRGNSKFSYLRSATVYLLGRRISILSGQRGSVEVDGVRKSLPVILESGNIEITVSGIRGTIQSSVGLEVSFDWSTLFMVTISSSYYGNLQGICGNYNGDPKDDFTMPSGVLTTNITEWAGSWSFDDKYKR
ncbi:IgGFc-binding protein-like [Osmerus eperlanus]|uniref:IgGFc-binding protein-like n=1 Tax=Osmerus eperlanus TaxID=29151 RepID=UPI002E0EF016